MLYCNNVQPIFKAEDSTPGKMGYLQNANMRAVSFKISKRLILAFNPLTFHDTTVIGGAMK